MKKINKLKETQCNYLKKIKKKITTKIDICQISHIY